MRDIDVRTSLRSQVEALHKGEDDTRILDELGLCGGLSRVDLAVLNGSIHGYEIKSDRDTLNRLPGQIQSYNQVFDYVTLVVGTKHLSKVESLVPDWWGLKAATLVGDKVELADVRPAAKNENIDPFWLCYFLWKEEALQIADAFGLATGVRSKPREKVYARLAENLDLDKLRELVRDKLKSRSGWRVASPRE